MKFKCNLHYMILEIRTYSYICLSTFDTSYAALKVQTNLWVTKRFAPKLCLLPHLCNILRSFEEITL